MQSKHVLTQGQIVFDYLVLQTQLMTEKRYLWEWVSDLLNTATVNNINI